MKKFIDGVVAVTAVLFLILAFVYREINLYSQGFWIVFVMNKGRWRMDL